jgi:hypothetical protein
MQVEAAAAASSAVSMDISQQSPSSTSTAMSPDTSCPEDSAVSPPQVASDSAVSPPQVKAVTAPGNSSLSSSEVLALSRGVRDTLLLLDFDKTLTDFDAGERVMEELAPELLPMLVRTSQGSAYGAMIVSIRCYDRQHTVL